MKRLQFSVLVAFIIFGLSLSASAGDLKVKFAIGEWGPYTGKRLENYGMASEIVTAACNAVGITPEYHFFPWKRAVQNVSSGTFFGTYPYKEIPERKGKYYFTKPLVSSSFGILMYKKNPKTGNFNYSQIADLKKFKVGIVAGTDAIRIPLEKMGIKVEEVQKADTNIKKLELERIDLIIDDRAVLYQALKSTYTAEPGKIDEFKFAENNFGEKNEFKIMVSLTYPDSKELLEKIDDGLMKIRSNGEYLKILNKYGLKE